MHAPPDRPTLLLTRPPREARRVAALLPGVDCLRMPLQATRLTPASALGDAATWAASAAIHIHVSRAAVAGAARIGSLGKGVHVAVGRATAQALAVRGVVCLRAAEDSEDSEGVLALPALQAVRGARIALYAAPGGRTHLQEALSARGAEVRTLWVYRRYPLRARPRAVQRLRCAAERAVLSASSVSLLEGLDLLLVERGLTTLRARPLIVASSRIAAVARDLGWRDVRIAKGASAAAFADAMRAIVHTPGAEADG